jgi:RNA polymerase sigma-70 factor (ECF subfamily)
LESTHALFERLVAEHERDVLRVARAVARDVHLGADAAQEAFVRLWCALQRNAAPARPGAWLRTAAISAALDAERRERVRPRTGLAAEPASPRASDPLTEAELALRYDRALATLSQGQRTVFVLKHDGGLSLAEVAAALDLALPTVKTQFARACTKLQQALRPFES